MRRLHAEARLNLRKIKAATALAWAKVLLPKGPAPLRDTKKVARGVRATLSSTEATAEGLPSLENSTTEFVHNSVTNEHDN